MKKIWKNYKTTLVLLLALVIGGIVGWIFKEDATVLMPFGDIFINLMFVIIVPLIFLTITAAIIKMENPKRLGKIISRTMLVIVVMSVIVVLIGIVATYTTKLIKAGDSAKIQALFDETSVIDKDLSILERTVSLITVNDFVGLFSRTNMIALLIFSILVGFALRMTKGIDVIKKAIIELNDMILNLLKIIMWYAPIGLGCYFAALIGTYGEMIAAGFLKTFIIYTITCTIVYLLLYSGYAFLAGGKKGLKRYWQNVLPPTVTALATCSSAASIPVNITSTKNIGVSDDIAEVIIPIGTSIHKEGSIIGSVFKIMFLVYLLDTSPSVWTVIGVSLVATLLVSAVPIGGGTISEMMILTLMGFPAAALPILTIIATVIDAPATTLNVVGNTSAAMLVARTTDGKKWLKS